MELIFTTFAVIMCGVVAVLTFKMCLQMRRADKLLNEMAEQCTNLTDEQKEELREHFRKTVIVPIAKQAVSDMMKDGKPLKWGDEEIMWGDKKVSA